jgi:putative permease
MISAGNSPHHNNAEFHEATMSQQAIRPLLLLLTAAAICVGAYAVQHTVSCFLLSFVLAYLFDPLVVFLEKRQIRRLYGIIILYGILGLFSLFFFAYLFPLIASRWAALLNDLPHYLQKGKEIAIGWKTRVRPAYASEEWSWLANRLIEQLDALASKLGAGLYFAASRVAFNLFNLLLSPILVFFMLFYKREIIDGIVVWLPLRHRQQILQLGREVNASIGGYLRGQLIVSVIVAIFSTIALFVLDIDNALLNGIFAGLASVLPFIGVILATIPPLFFAYIKFQSGVVLLKVIGAFAVIYFLEGYLVKPLVFKESMDLNPLLTIIVVMAFGELLGFWGILLAIPIAAALKIVSVHWRRGDFAREG